jgi:hypothetical protein
MTIQKLNETPTSIRIKMIFIVIPALLLITYVVGLIGAMHAREAGSPIIGLLYGVPVFFLSLVLLLPSLEIIDGSNSLPLTYWLWMLFTAAPLFLSWLTIWNGFRKHRAGAKWTIGILVAVMILGILVTLYIWPAPVLVILHFLPKPPFAIL